MRFVLFLVLLSACVASEQPDTPTAVAPLVAAKVGDDPSTTVCQCSPNFEELGCDDGDIDNDCVCNTIDNCRINPNCDRANADGDAFGDVCDQLPNTPDPESAIAALDGRLDALEGADHGEDITALQADVALLTAALVQIRTRYPAHYHGLLGLAGDPVGTNGDLSYSLPGD